jgi:predicted DNA-binding ribbon-helix-helix protein
MATLSLRLPESLHRKLAELAQKEGVSINQLISSAAAEKLAALMTEEYLADRAKRASKAKFTAALSRVPRAKPIDGDELPAAYVRRTRRRAG